MAISELQVSGKTPTTRLGASSKSTRDTKPSPLAALSDPSQRTVQKKDYKKKGAAPVDDFGGTNFGTPGLLGDGK